MSPSISSIPSTFTGYALLQAGACPERVERDFTAIDAGAVRVRVAGCGLCHTDLGFAFGGVRTRHALPLILGHEISGIVEAAGEGAAHWVGRAVVVPAVIPCGHCADCKDGYAMICKQQIMPGNDVDGGFATHVVVPAHALCAVPGADPDAVIGVGGVTLRHLAVIADAVSTPYQAVTRAEVGAGDLVVVVGLGGVGGYAVKIAALRGARVVGIDIDAARRDAGMTAGCGLTLDPRGMPAKELRAAVTAYAKSVGARVNRWKIFECSGVVAGQEIAFGLLVHGATLMVVGYTPEPSTLRMSNLMAFDARLIGNWGCAPELYPEIVAHVLAGRLELCSSVEIRPLSALPATFAEAQHGHAGRRVVFAPDRCP